MKKIRASNLPRAHQCKKYCALCLSGDIPERDRTSEEARKGQAVHKALEYYAAGKICDYEAIAGEFGITEKKFVYLVPAGIERIREYQEAGYEIVAPERQLENELITGKCDLVMKHNMRGKLLVIDWKTGAVVDCYAQVVGYALLAYDADTEGGCEKMYAAAEFIGEATQDIYEITPVKAREFVQGIIDAADVNRPTSGKHCAYCECRGSCEEYLAYVEESGSELVALSGGGVTRPLQDLYEQSKILECSLNRFKRVLREKLEAAGGELKLSDGRTIRIVDGVDRMKIHITEDTKELIERYIPQGLNEIQRNMKLSKSNFWDLPVGFFSAGKKTSTVKELLSELEKAGAISHKYDQKIVIE